ncbi:hypothetical protein NDU88_008007 [Pleurodeles waltl]|uniref:Uncharacterized protein n=1 Tax=Pleurodeles waltl TaxID=8319 RepID=A0AAV7RTI4_PLEWA|nr:hypothetical protein NDU88_008007 [Pleurodeles waltl]
MSDASRDASEHVMAAACPSRSFSGGISHRQVQEGAGESRGHKKARNPRSTTGATLSPAGHRVRRRGEHKARPPAPPKETACLLSQCHSPPGQKRSAHRESTSTGAPGCGSMMNQTEINAQYNYVYEEEEYMNQEDEWDRDMLLDPAWEKQQRKVSSAHTPSASERGLLMIERL